MLFTSQTGLDISSLFENEYIDQYALQESVNNCEMKLRMFEYDYNHEYHDAEMVAIEAYKDHNDDMALLESQFEVITEGFLGKIWEKFKSFLKMIWNGIVKLVTKLLEFLHLKKKKIEEEQKKADEEEKQMKEAGNASSTSTSQSSSSSTPKSSTTPSNQSSQPVSSEKPENMSQAIQQQEEKKQEEKKKEQLTVEDIPITNRFIWIDPINAGSNLNQWETGIKSLTHILGNFLNNVNVDKETGVLTNKTNNKIYNEIISTLSDNITVDNTYNDQEYIKLVDKVLDLDSSEFNGEKMLIYPLRLNEDVSVKRIDAILKILGSKKMFFETSDKSLDEYWGIYTVKTERKYRKKFLDAVDKYVNKSLLIELETAYKSIDKMIDEAEKNEKYDENKAGHNIAIKISRFLSIGFRVLYFNQLLLFKAISQISYWSELQESKSIEKYLLENN